jgi:hypothetical protein
MPVEDENQPRRSTGRPTSERRRQSGASAGRRARHRAAKRVAEQRERRRFALWAAVGTVGMALLVTSAHLVATLVPDLGTTGGQRVLIMLVGLLVGISGRLEDRIRHVVGWRRVATAAWVLLLDFLLLVPALATIERWVPGVGSSLLRALMPGLVLIGAVAVLVRRGSPMGTVALAWWASIGGALAAFALLVEAGLPAIVAATLLGTLGWAVLSELRIVARRRFDPAGVALALLNAPIRFPFRLLQDLSARLLR